MRKTETSGKNHVHHIQSHSEPLPSPPSQSHPHVLHELSRCHAIGGSYMISWRKVSPHSLFSGASRAKQIIQGGFLFFFLHVTVSCKKKCLKRNHLPKPSPTYLIIIKMQCAMRSLGTLRDPPLDSYHMQLASLINGVFMLQWRGSSACLLQGFDQQLEIKHCSQTLIDTSHYHQGCFHI